MKKVKEMSVEFMIDEPIRNCVAVLNLIPEWKTLWSCCAYDYPGQVEDASHHYRHAYIRILIPRGNATFKNFIYYLFEKNIGWKFDIMGENADYLDVTLHTQDISEIEKDRNAVWTDPKSKHFFERSVAAIWRLEKLLVSFIVEYGIHLRSEVTVTDNNISMVEYDSRWQTDCYSNWHIERSKWYTDWVSEKFPDMAGKLVLDAPQHIGNNTK